MLLLSDRILVPKLDKDWCPPSPCMSFWIWGFLLASRTVSGGLWKLYEFLTLRYSQLRRTSFPCKILCGLRSHLAAGRRRECWVRSWVKRWDSLQFLPNHAAPDFPTAEYIERHIEAYTNPNLTIWEGDRSVGGFGQEQWVLVPFLSFFLIILSQPSQPSLRPMLRCGILKRTARILVLDLPYVLITTHPQRRHPLEPWTNFIILEAFVSSMHMYTIQYYSLFLHVHGWYIFWYILTDRCSSSIQERSQRYVMSWTRQCSDGERKQIGNYLGYIRVKRFVSCSKMGRGGGLIDNLKILKMRINSTLNLWDK